MTDAELARLVDKEPKGIHISACSKEISVSMSLPLLNLLSAPSKGPWSKAEVWFHAQIVWACGVTSGYDKL